MNAYLSLESIVFFGFSHLPFWQPWIYVKAFGEDATILPTAANRFRQEAKASGWRVQAWDTPFSPVTFHSKLRCWIVLDQKNPCSSMFE